MGARAALKEVEGIAAQLDMYSTEYEGTYDLPRVGLRRRRLRAGDPDPVSTASLMLNEQGVLLWREGAPSGELAGRRLRRGLAAAPEGELVELYQYEKLEPNEINRFLTNLDGKLNDRAGLWRLDYVRASGAAPASVDQVQVAAPAGKKRRLLLVHGTFSKGEAFLHGIGKAPGGDRFLKRIFGHYDEVLLFEHPTLSVSPVLNAFDLFGLLGKASGPLDIVAHSRGGLVVRWFLEGFGAAVGGGPYRAVLVGSPLGGTSLASPPRLRDALSMLSNIGTALKMAGTASVVYFPLLAAPLALLKIATSAVSVAAKTPIVDAAVSMVPGLAGQSRVDLNQELDRVRGFSVSRPPTYFIVQSNFETEDPGWRFWEWFRADRMKDFGADKVFPGPNDLVVDTRSMSEFAAAAPAGVAPSMPASRRHDFGTTAVVHHTNYFEQKGTWDFILDKFGVQ
ncbi:MAG: hypothetical protein OEZ09_00325 [Betaproteobacteria bacterium]|nr:hypothetical protein [Betaproteobacteria bacterium]